MKKIIVAVSVALIGFSLNAAVANWAAEGISGYNGGAMSALQIYAFDTSKLTVANATAAFSTGDFSALEKGFVATDYDSGEAVGEISGYENGAAVSAYLVIFDNATVASSEHFYISEIDDSSSIGIQGQSANPAFDLSSSATASNWIATAAPEPTSGLLLLLGMAGLALKRKRA